MNSVRGRSDRQEDGKRQEDEETGSWKQGGWRTFIGGASGKDALNRTCIVVS